MEPEAGGGGGGEERAGSWAKSDKLPIFKT